MTAKTKDEPLLIPQGMVDPADIGGYPGNYRKHDDEAIEQSIGEFGLLSPVVVNRRNMKLVGGHGVLAGWRRDRPGQPIQVSWVDVDERTHRKMLLALNRTHDRGEDDPQALYAMLFDLDGDLTGTGFDDDDVESMRSDLSVEEEEEREREGPTLDPKGDSFTFDNMHRAGTRILVLEFELDAYKWAQDKLATLAREMGLDSNVDVVVRLIADRIGEDPPPTITAAERAAIDGAVDGDPF